MQAVAATDAPRPRQTIRRYAHELYPHAKEEAEARPLAVEVPYLYAQALGHNVLGTSWFDMWHGGDRTDDTVRVALDRTLAMIRTGHMALLADALYQGLTGDAAWEWAVIRTAGDNLGEWVWERAVEHSVDPDAIKPYPCGPEPQTHDHHGDRDDRGWRSVTHVPGPESECDECCEPEPVVVADEALPLDGGDGQ